MVVQDFRGRAFRLCPVGNQNEVTRHEIQLTCRGIGSVHNHQDQSLRVRPILRLVHSQLDDLFVALSGSAGQRVGAQAAVSTAVRQVERALRSCEYARRTHLFHAQFVHHRAFNVSGIKANVEAPSRLLRLVHDIANETLDSIGGVHATLAKDAVNEAIAQTLAVSPRASSLMNNPGSSLMATRVGVAWSTRW